MRGIHIFRIILVRKTLDFKGFSCLILTILISVVTPKLLIHTGSQSHLTHSRMQLYIS